MKPCKEHDWEEWKTLCYKEYPSIGIGAIRTCKICKWREYNDWCSTRTGTDFKILPPEEI